MAQDSGITWTHHTFNPWSGCTKVSPGCKFCYAESLSNRFNKSNGSGSIGDWGPDGTRKVKAESGWDEPLKWNKWAANAICYSCGGSGEKRERDVENGIGIIRRKPCTTCNGYGRFKKPYEALVFCASLADIFEDYNRQLQNSKNELLFAGSNFYRKPVLCEWFTTGNKNLAFASRDRLTTAHVLFRLFDMVRQTPNLMWLLLTKRPEKVLYKLIESSRTMYGSEYDETVIWLASWAAGIEVPQNVAMGTSVESQGYEGRIVEILKVPARLHWVSAEPLLGELDIEGHLENGLKWVVAGGESGKDKDVRPCHPDWVRDLRDQCKRTNACFHFKQWGEYAEGMQREDWTSVANDGSLSVTDLRLEVVAMSRIGKSKSGRLLDGKIEDGFPDLFKMPEVIESKKAVQEVEPLPEGYSLADQFDAGGSD